MREFLQAYYNWARFGAPEDDKRFSRRKGLCANFANWLLWMHPHYDAFERWDARNVLREALRRDFGDYRFPFNKDGYHYQTEALNGQCHLNTARLAWVKEKLA